MKRVPLGFGVMAAASAGIYFHRGYIAPGQAMPVTLGVVAGSLAGAKQLSAAPSQHLGMLFRAVILVLGVEMIYNGWTGLARARRPVPTGFVGRAPGLRIGVKIRIDIVFDCGVV